MTAPYAVAVFNGKNVTSKPPKTEIWCMLYAQVRQADARKNRNILLAESKLRYLNPQDRLKTRVDRFLAERKQLPLKTANSIRVNLDAPSVGVSQWTEDEIIQLLDQFNLAPDTGLSVLAVEMMPRYDQYIYRGPPADDTIRPLSAGGRAVQNSADFTFGSGTGNLLTGTCLGIIRKAVSALNGRDFRRSAPEREPADGFEPTTC